MIVLNPDWSFLIRSLNEKGLTEHAIACRIGLKQPAVHLLKKGEYREPKYRTGLLILDLCKEHEVSIKQKTSVVGSN